MEELSICGLGESPPSPVREAAANDTYLKDEGIKARYEYTVEAQDSSDYRKY